VDNVQEEIDRIEEENKLTEPVYDFQLLQNEVEVGEG